MMASATADANEFMAEANTTNLFAMWLQRPTGMKTARRLPSATI
jgi:hypothetical protein